MYSFEDVILLRAIQQRLRLARTPKELRGIYRDN